jgi:hypothetical protein
MGPAGDCARTGRREREMTTMIMLYQAACTRYRPETIRRHEARLVGAIYARLEALRELVYLRRIHGETTPRDL